MKSEGLVAMNKVVLSGTGHYLPPCAVSNEELVACFNQYVVNYNEKNKAAIERGELKLLAESSVEFIVKASGIKNRYFLEKTGILDPNRMSPYIPVRTADEPSLQAEMAVEAAKEALANAGKTAADIDMVIASCSTTQRDYPAIAIEVQKLLGIKGSAFDMKVACSSATFALQLAFDSVRSGSVRSVLIVSPEMTAGNLDFRDRDSHFIFGDACAALVIERRDQAKVTPHTFEILSTQLMTEFSNNIRNEFGCLSQMVPGDTDKKGRFFSQNGKKVFKEVVPMAALFIQNHLSQHQLETPAIKRFWLHQANINMNELIAKKLLGREATREEAPIVLDQFANTGACGSVLAFHFNHQDFKSGDMGVLCSFGAGYSVGSALLQKV